MVPSALLSLLRDGTPLSGVDNLAVAHCGIVLWRVKVGDWVVKGQLLAEIMDVEDVDAARIPVLARCDGQLLTLNGNMLHRPGQRLAKIVSDEPLAWRKGDLLSL